jgi:PIN domain nuclease of toxin-antitoxin system
VTFLLDTHVLLWWQMDDERLSARCRELMADGRNPLLWSAASSWELAIKVGLGRLRLPEPVHRYVPRVLRRNAIHSLAIEQGHALAVAALPSHHRDPFDRLLVAQARMEKIALLSADEQFDAYGVDRVW